MDVRSTERTRKSSTIAWLTRDWLLDVFRLWAEELDRAFIAAQHYEALPFGRESDLSLRDRASRARLVFDRIYADR
jgi:hypothetical protein